MAQDTSTPTAEAPKSIPAGDFIQSHIARLRHSYDGAFTLLQGLKTLSENDWTAERKNFAWQPMAPLALNFSSSLDFARAATLHQFAGATAQLVASLSRLLIQIGKEDGFLDAEDAADDSIPEGELAEETAEAAAEPQKSPEDTWIDALQKIWGGAMPEPRAWKTIAQLPQIFMLPPSNHPCFLLRPDFQKQGPKEVQVNARPAELTTQAFPPHRQALEWLQIIHFTAGILMHELVERVKILRPPQEPAPVLS